MRTIHKSNQILVLPYIAPGDLKTIQAQCSHGVTLFPEKINGTWREPCFDCIFESNIQRMADGLEAEEPKYEEITIDCERCFHRTYFVFPLGELLVCESCWKKAGAE